MSLSNGEVRAEKPGAHRGYAILRAVLIKAQALVAAVALIGCGHEPSGPSEPAGPPRRVVSIAPNLAEIVADIGGASQLVGLSSYGRVPPGAEHARRVGGFVDPSIEHIISLEPDLVIGVTLQHRALRACTTAGLRTLELNCQTLEQALEAYGILGEALGHQDKADHSRRQLDQQLDQVRQKASRHTPKRTLILLGRAGEDLQQVYPVAQGNFTHQLLELAGGRNVLNRAAPSISTESVIVLSPEVIIEVAMDEPGGGGAQPVRYLEPSPLWPRLPSVPAVRNDRVFAVESSSLLQPGPEMADGAALLYRLLHEPRRPR